MAARQAVGDVNVAGGECVAGDVAFEVLGECRVLHVLTEATLLCAQVGAAARCWCGSAVDRGHALRQLPRVTVAGPSPPPRVPWPRALLPPSSCS
jgi:hypothetical protein